MKGWRADEISEEGGDDEVEIFCKNLKKEDSDKKMEGVRRSKNDQDQTCGKDVGL